MIKYAPTLISGATTSGYVETSRKSEPYLNFVHPYEFCPEAETLNHGAQREIAEFNEKGIGNFEAVFTSERLILLRSPSYMANGRDLGETFCALALVDPPQ